MWLLLRGIGAEGMCGGAFSGAVTLMGLQRLIKVFAVRASEEGKRRNNMVLDCSDVMRKVVSYY